jgi:hypothetical protein
MHVLFLLEILADIISYFAKTSAQGKEAGAAARNELSLQSQFNGSAPSDR